jgi:N-acetylmuramoyl-L-alanine amidase
MRGVMVGLWMLGWVACQEAAPTPVSTPQPVETATAEAHAEADTRALRVLPTQPVRGTLLLDAGHGAPGNPGNENCRCEAEQDVMLRVAGRVRAWLRQEGVKVRETRPDGAPTPYPERLRMTRGVDWMVSLHSDSRAGYELMRDPATGCWRNHGATGFAVLWSDEGEKALVDGRHGLARALARRMVEAGFEAYPGRDYDGLYAGDEVPGVFVDRHEDRKRIMLLRRPKAPSVIVETHQAWDVGESAMWEQEETASAFASAIAAALADQEGAAAGRGE